MNAICYFNSFVLENGQLFLLRRKKVAQAEVRGFCLLPGKAKYPHIVVVENPEEPKVLSLPGGTVESGERPVEAITREWYEEVGDPLGSFDVSRIDLYGHPGIPKEREEGRFLMHLFRVTRFGDPYVFPKKANQRFLHLRERPFLIRADDRKIKSLHRAALSLVLPILKYPPLDLTEEERREEARIKLLLEID